MRPLGQLSLSDIDMYAPVPGLFLLERGFSVRLSM